MNKIIGEILEDGTIVRGETDQGFVYWNKEAFDNKSGVCYIAELRDDEYTYEDFITLAKGNEEVATMLFETVDWQSPEALYYDCLNEDEVAECDSCDRTYLSYSVDKCPICGEPKKQ